MVRPGPYLMLVLGLPVVVAGCADTPPAPIEDRTGYGQSRASSKVVTESPAPANRINAIEGQPYIVQKGDTLYAIAFSLGMDYQDLAQINNIPPPFTIYIGQRIDMVAGPGPDKTAVVVKTDNQVAPTSKAPSTKPTVTKSPNNPKPADPVPAKSTPTVSVAKTVTKPAAVVAVAPRVVPPAPKVTPTKAIRTPATKPTAAPKMKLGRVDRWLWPGKGKVVRPYSTSLHKGLDIAGSRGEPVRAAAPGVVVYAGTGVKGYGALLIVKHNDTFLSAYGHNDAILVDEGAAVNAGQQIARMGSTGTDTVKLHFEIRKQGKPVNPTSLLPKR